MGQITLFKIGISFCLCETDDGNRTDSDHTHSSSLVSWWGLDNDSHAPGYKATSSRIGFDSHVQFLKD